MRKKNKLALLAISALIGGGILSACTPRSSSSPDASSESSASSSESTDTSTESSSVSSDESKESSSSEAKTEFSISFDATSDTHGTEVQIYKDYDYYPVSQFKFKKGDTVQLDVYCASADISGVKANDIACVNAAQSNIWTFTMPAADVVISVEYAEASSEYTITYDEEKMTIFTDVTTMTAITKASAGDIVYVYISGESATVTGVFYNKTSTTKDTTTFGDNGWNFSKFTMPAEAVTITYTVEETATAHTIALSSEATSGIHIENTAAFYVKNASETADDFATRFESASPIESAAAGEEIWIFFSLADNDTSTISGISYSYTVDGTAIDGSASSSVSSSTGITLYYFSMPDADVTINVTYTTASEAA